MAASPSSCERGGVAAQQRAGKKCGKYGPAVAAQGGVFRAAVMERFGACSDDLCGLVSQLCGEGERAHDAEDWTFTAPSRVTYFMQHVVFAGVMADAEMVDRALELDVAWRAPEAVAAARGGFG